MLPPGTFVSASRLATSMEDIERREAAQSTHADTPQTRPGEGRADSVQDRRSKSGNLFRDFCRRFMSDLLWKANSVTLVL